MEINDNLLFLNTKTRLGDKYIVETYSNDDATRYSEEKWLGDEVDDNNCLYSLYGKYLFSIRLKNPKQKKWKKLHKFCATNFNWDLGYSTKFGYNPSEILIYRILNKR